MAMPPTLIYGYDDQHTRLQNVLTPMFLNDRLGFEWQNICTTPEMSDFFTVVYRQHDSRKITNAIWRSPNSLEFSMGFV